MLRPVSKTLLRIGCFVPLLLADQADAQIVRRMAGGGVQINAPFVRVNVGPGGTSVRAPFTAINRPGGAYVGRRRRLLGQPPLPPTQQPTGANPAAADRSAAPAPEVADVDALPYPTADQLAAMDDRELIETLRQMMARLHYRLSLLKTGKGWQRHLVLSRALLGSPGAPPEAVDFDEVRTVLPRYESVQNDSRYVKISTFPSFVATYDALLEIERRADNYTSDGPKITDPGVGNSTAAEAPATEPPSVVTPAHGATPVEPSTEILPTPESSEVPNATRGERSILKRK